MEELFEPIILDTGSHTTVVGTSDENTDKKEFPTIVGRPRGMGVMVGMGQKDCYVGTETQSKRYPLTMRQPYYNGKVQNWDDIEKVWHHAFYNELRRAPEEHPLALTEKTFTPKEDREKTTQIMFETFNVPYLYIGNSAAMSLYDTDQRTTGLVLEMGEDLNYVVPIYQMSCMQDYAKISGVGGSFLNAHLIQILSGLGYDFQTNAEKDIVRELKEKFGIVFPLVNNSTNIELNESDLYFQSTSGNEETKNNNKDQNLPNTNYENKRIIIHELYDGKILKLNDKVFFLTNPLFDPKLVEVNKDFIQLTYKAYFFRQPTVDKSYYEKGIQEHVFETIQSLPEELQQIMYQNIVLAGGNSMFNGLKQRLINELYLFFAENHPKFNVIAPKSRKYSSFNGCKKFTKLDNFLDYCINFNEYEEFGPNLAIRKFW
ncbi:actin-7-related [Anaeramoeba flamelloides]|uniref:Actin-7-related n=1 Tax=Anaeramoeba flamelloides TaxID=1746091 RepID=A0AAV7YK65_9EUKA|nr:actin-7-related [Anaeramoeba flamelloides]